jgi:hypothetical protein
MSKVDSLENPRDQTQAKVFTRWLNLHLSKAREPFTVVDLGSDLVSGEALVLISEVFVKGNQLKYSKSPKNQLQRTQNHTQAIDRFESDNLQLINIHASTLANDEVNNIKIFMGYIFQLIIRYSVGNIDDELDAEAKKKQASLAQLKQQLIDWVNAKLSTLSPAENKQIRQYSNSGDSDEQLIVKNLDQDWTDGSVLTGLCIALHPVDKRQNGFEKLSQRSAELNGDSLQAVIERSDKNLTVAQLIEADEIRTAPDVNSMLTYVSGFKNAKYVDDEPIIEKVVIDWDEGKFLQIEVDSIASRNLDVLNTERDVIVAKLDEYNANVAAGEKVYEESCHCKAKRMDLHLRRVIAVLKNDNDDKVINGNKDDENKRIIDEKDAQIGQEEDKVKKLEQDLADAIKKAQDDLDEANKKAQNDLDEAKKKNQDLEAAIAKLQKKQSRLGELQAALLACAAISDEMLNDEASA